jgi:hypothetical protein
MKKKTEEEKAHLGAIVLESIVLNLVLAKAASTDLNMRIPFLRHANKLNLEIH